MPAVSRNRTWDAWSSTRRSPARAHTWSQPPPSVFRSPMMEPRLDQRQSLSASWLLRLVREAGYDVPQTSLSMTPFIIGRPDDFLITVTPQDSSPWITAVSSDQSRQEEINKLVQRSGELASGALASEEDFGGLVWYTGTLV